MTPSLDNVLRRADVDRETLLREHAYLGQPVILTDAFARPPREALGDSIEAVVSHFANVRLPFRPEYGTLLMTCLRQGPPPEGANTAVEATLAEYWEMVRSAPDTPVMCAEEATPPEVAASVGVPRAALGDEDMRSTVFIGNAGNVAPIHFDGDCRHVLLHQLFGRKRVVMLPPSASSSLRPVVNFSTLWLRGLGDEELRDLVRRLGGWECVLLPGETLLMPALIWHGVRYLDDGMSVNFRFGRHRWHRFVSEQLHSSPRVQALAAATVDPRSIAEGGALADRWRRVVECWARPTSTPGMRFAEIEACLEGRGVEDEAPPIPAVEWPDEWFASLPAVVVDALERAHLFNQRLYLHRKGQDVDAWSRVVG